MEVSLKKNELQNYIKHQLDNIFPDDIRFEGKDVEIAISRGLDRLEYCYDFITVPAYYHDNQTWFSHLHGDQYSQFLYFFSNSLWELNQNKPICDKIMQLNRMLSGCYWSYKSGLPDIFYWSHPVGTVLGKAPYGNFFSCRHGCTIATQASETTNQWGEGLFLGAGSGLFSQDIKIGKHVVVGGGTLYYSKEVLDDNVFLCRDDNGAIIKTIETEAWYGRLADVIWRRR